MKEIKYTKLKEIIYYDKCSNGLEIYMLVNEKVSNYYATLNVKYGSIDTNFKVDDKEYKVTNGIAHYLEHINFNVDETKTANDYFDTKGTSVNAFTTYEYTAYEIYGSNNILGDVNHLLDFVQKKTIYGDLIEKERGIISEEINMVNSIPSRKLYKAINENIYFKNNKRFEIAGTKEDIKKISKKELELVFDNFYRPDNMFLVVTGNFNPYELAASIKENQKNKKAYNKTDNIKKIYEKDDIKLKKDYIEVDGNIEIPKVAIFYKMSRKIFKDYSDNDLKLYLRIIINGCFGPTSNLKEDLMEKELINTLTCGIEVDKDSVMIFVMSETKYPEELISIVKKNMKNMNLTEERFKRRIKCNISDLITRFDDIEGINSFIQDDLIFNNKITNNIYSIFTTAKYEDALDILKLLELNNNITVLLKPQKNTNES